MEKISSQASRIKKIRDEYLVSKTVLVNRYQRSNKKTLNYHLKFIGADRYLEFFYPKDRHLKKVGEVYSTLKDRHEYWEIFWAAKKAYRDCVRSYHPDNNRGVPTAVRDMGEITESWNWIKERYDENGKKRWRKRNNS